MLIAPVELVKDQIGYAEITIDRPGASATVELRTLGGTSRGVPTASSLSSADEAVVTVVSDDQITVADASGFEKGQPVWHEESETRLWVARVSGLTITFEVPPAEPFQAGDTIQTDSLWMLATVPAALTATLGVDHVLRWTVTYAGDASVGEDTVEVIDQPCYVVATKFRPSPRREDCARFLATVYPSMAQDFVGERIRNLVLRSQSLVRRKVQETGRFAHLTGDSSAFYEAGLLALKMVLIDEGLWPRNVDQVAYMQQLRSSFHGAVMGALKTLATYDADESGTIEDDELRTLGAIPLGRY